MNILWPLLCCLLLLTGCSTYEVSRNSHGEMSEFTPTHLPLNVIVIDPGHGGDDYGCSNEDETLNEKTLTLATSNLLKKHLQKLGYRVIMTRTSDVRVALDKRARLANELNAEAFVSVHFNHAENTSAQGVEVFYHKQATNLKRTEESHHLAQAVLRSVLLATNARSRGVKTANYRVIKKTEMPAILVEAGFLSHEKESSRCKDPDYMDAIAWGIAQGINNYFRSLDKI